MDPETLSKTKCLVETLPNTELQMSNTGENSVESILENEIAASENAEISNIPSDFVEGETILHEVCYKTVPYDQLAVISSMNDDPQEVEDDAQCNCSDDKSDSSTDMQTETAMDMSESPVDKQTDVPIDKLTCRLCKRKFTKHTNKIRHIRRVHNVRVGNSTCIKCIECNITFTQLNPLREHLAMKHNLEMLEHQLRFPNLEAFQKWKCELERKTLCSYILRHGARKGPNGPRYFYACHRSGKYLPKTKCPQGERQRMIKTQGSCKMGILCTSAIAVHISPQEVLVKYCPNHYGHGKETTLIQLSTQEQDAIKESVSQGMSYEKLLDEIRDGQSTKDHFQLFLLKKKDIRCINNAYNFDDFNASMADSESVDHWVSVCCQMENSPILFYRKEESSSDKNYQEEFTLIIMTEYQKHILQLCDKKIICVDSLYRKKGGRFYLTVLFIMDETELAFPAAFCISNKVDQHILSTFYQAINEAAGELHCTFFMSDCEAFYYDMWKMVMNDNPRWLWSMWYVDNRFRIQLRVFRGKIEKRAEAYRTMRMLLECQNPTVFQCMLKNFVDSLKNDTDSKDLGNLVESYYAQNAEIWAYCYRKEIDLSTNIHLEIMHRTFRYCCREGRKTRLDKFIFVIMKLVRDKMLERLCALLDDEKIDISLTTINECHKLGLEISADCITTLSDKTWLIQIAGEEDNYYVTREYQKCPEHCNLKCFECNICVHMYVCSCVHNIINANLCQHIHAVVWHLLTPHFSPPSSPVPLLDTSKLEDRAVESEFFSSLLKKCHEVYKQICINKTKLNAIALNSLMKRLNECIDVCTGKLVFDNSLPKFGELPINTPIYVINSLPLKPTMNKNEPMLANPTGCSSQSILVSSSVPMTSNKLVQFSNSASAAYNNQPIIISNATPTSKNYPIQPSSCKTAGNRSITNSNVIASQGTGGYYFLLPSNTSSVPIKVENS